MKQIARSRTNRVVLGVAGGLAEYFDIDATIIRLVFVVLALIQPGILLGYFIAALVIPERSAASRTTVDVRPTQPTGTGTAPSDSDIDRELEELARAGAAATGTADAPKTVTQHDHHRTSMVLGLGLAGIGTILLFREFVPWIDLGRFWPLLIIGLGGLIVWRSVEH